MGKTGREKKRESLTDWLTGVHFLLHHLHERSHSCPLLLRRIERYSRVCVSCCGWLQAFFFSSCDPVSSCRKHRDAVPVLCYRANDLLVVDVEAIPSTSKHFQSTAKFNSRVRCVMTKSVSNLSWKNSSRWFRHINLFVCRFLISFFLFYGNWFKQIPRDYKIFTISGQLFFNPIIAVPREIHTPPGNEEEMPLKITTSIILQ